MSAPKPIAAGNWKMNGLKASAVEARSLVEKVSQQGSGDAEVLICPPFTLLGLFADIFGGTGVTLGAQDCHANASGAHTGDISAEMIKDTGADYVIVGHSERRADHGESDAVVKAKAEAAYRAGLKAIICVGETEGERDSDKTIDVVCGQLDGSIPDDATAETTVIAYEPVWAIGTGKTPTADDVKEVHAAIRDNLVKRFGAAGEGMRLLYGGSVKPSNAEELMSVANVNGALVGGASLKADDFDGIINAYR